jgi:DNA-binding MarR family transcriptional regulator
VVFLLVGGGFWVVGVYDLTVWCPALQVEDLDECVLVGAGFGEGAAGFGAAAGGGVDQHGFLDAGEVVERAMVALRHLQARHTLSRLSLERTGIPGDTAVFGVLDMTDEANRRGRPRTISAVAKALHVDQPRASKLVARAVEAGLVEPMADQADGRKSILALTPDELAGIEETHTFRRSIFAKAMAGWPPGDQETFGRLRAMFAERYEGNCQLFGVTGSSLG